MSCCSAKGCDEFFSDRVARRNADSYRRKGLDKHARRLVDAVCRNGIEGRTVLEVGGGIGAIQLELLQAGAARAENIELSPAYEPYAAELVRTAGLEGRVERRLMDFAVTAEAVDAADVVILHKVVCCYPDYEALVGAAAAHAKQQLVLTFPRRSWWTRLGFTAGEPARAAAPEDVPSLRAFSGGDDRCSSHAWPRANHQTSRGRMGVLRPRTRQRARRPSKLATLLSLAEPAGGA